MKRLNIILFVVGSLLIGVAQDTEPSRTELLAASCAACHGTNGHSNDDEIDSLAGMKAEKIMRRLKQFGNGERDSTVMHHFAAGYTEVEIAEIAAYFEGQED